ncbi:polyprenol phosphomannose-dependent alpha 1,6 mannosyltransferase MptB [Flagellimonas allohymeniacidonis]|uniref:Mannosyltransferase n=1 Tax=Flagellimonas allohymeniacidonis TaxID=2517819 RepID=A0A4Q8QHT3_9FLAO|nr:polyprenol phosphomannose-dependent alpha 1,6 mannosyltransferase MptB [Allomuricauda hymeniacidonis]TAI48009.1 mannosyltransferase [Allomuricauda hymeniacidonis]
MWSYWRLHKYPILFVLGSLLFYVSFAYDLNRTDFVKLITLYAGMSFLCLKLIQFEKRNFKFLLISGLLFRLVFLWMEPNLSQDFYRFIWDGELIKNGINPYIHLPKDLILQNNLPISNADQLFAGMGELSAKHFSNYPPLNQIIFTIAAFFGGGSIPGSVIAMRLLIIMADIGVLLFAGKLLKHLNLSPDFAFWYFLNPLVIIELTGNLHFEGVMLFFFVWALYLVSKGKWRVAAPVYALSIMTKLVPILFLPLFLRYFGIKKSIGFYFFTGTACLLLLLPFYSSVFVDNYSETVGLWFSNFEFNAGLYNLVKHIGTTYFDAKPWELIKSYGKVMVLAVIGITLVLAFFRKNEHFNTLLKSMLWVLACYLFLSSTVHPWYIVFLLVLGIFTKYRFPLVWSITVMLSYWAYSNPDYTENLWLLLIEYLAVFGVMIYELTAKEGKKLDFFKKLGAN